MRKVLENRRVYKLRRGAFIYNEAFCENSQLLKAVIYFRKNTPSYFNQEDNHTFFNKSIYLRVAFECHYFHGQA